MVWLLVLHIGALLFWCAALLYLPALISGTVTQRTEMTEPPQPLDSVPRFVFTHIATPAALAAIVFGTLTFAVGEIVAAWLIVKLTLVTGLAVVHALAGLLVLRLEDTKEKPVQPWCWLMTTVLCILMTAIVWIVLAKPFPGVLS